MARALVAVIGDGDAPIDVCAQAEDVGARLAHAGYGVVCGGLGGVMEAACRGAARAGGLTIGVLPGDSAATANPFVAAPIVTGLGEARNVIVVKSAAAVIAVGGKYGTLSEIAVALKLGIPVVGLGTWELRRNGVVDPGIVVAATPEEAVATAIRLIASASPQR
ncbi:MAG: TIGR00725 family protein [Dehalococcoidia bacterium]|nr:TIGR00725 family protein [Dehalococcoidia bacterium]